jgi:hypothetical protein
MKVVWKYNLLRKYSKDKTPTFPLLKYYHVKILDSSSK